ncbi:MAG: molybdopterin-guanine dinucleotide biosynthesis protein B [Candidatus Magnetomorum sp.]|nr:molybdopterin-guanine dinucleotide biosynthesis protein B [Candidatus Magnetomorum sp.]
MTKTEKPVILSFVGHSNSGKTGLITRIIPKIKARGVCVGVVKHACSPIAIDQQGKDSHRHFESGADPVMICTENHMALFSKRTSDMALGQIVQRFYKGSDLVLTEGFKQEHYPKIEVYRPENGASPLCMEDRSIIAIVTDHYQEWTVPRFCKDNLDELVDFIYGKVRVA